MSLLLEAVDLRASANGVPLLRGVTLFVRSGAIEALVGPTGAGKLHALRAIAGELPLDDGWIACAGERMERTAEHKRVRAGVVSSFRGSARNASSTLGDWVRRTAVARGIPGNELTARLEQLQRRFPVALDKDRLVHELSGGEQRIAELARAVVARPELLLADEPLLGIAPQTRTDVAAVLREEAERGAAVLITSSDAQAVLDLAAYVYRMERGRVVLEGVPRELPAEWLRDGPTGLGR